jgi:hypothetical protein
MTLRDDLTKEDVYELFCQHVTVDVPLVPIEDCRFYFRNDEGLEYADYWLHYDIYDQSYYVVLSVRDGNVCIRQSLFAGSPNQLLWSYAFPDTEGRYTQLSSDEMKLAWQQDEDDEYLEYSLGDYADDPEAPEVPEAAGAAAADPETTAMDPEADSADPAAADSGTESCKYHLREDLTKDQIVKAVRDLLNFDVTGPVMFEHVDRYYTIRFFLPDPDDWVQCIVSELPFSPPYTLFRWYLADGSMSFASNAIQIDPVYLKENDLVEPADLKAAAAAPAN